jgi:hypothetical protein
LTATQENGEPFYAPDVSDADLATVHYWSRRSGESGHPILRARYADIEWDLGRLIDKKSSDVNRAQAT